MRKFSFMLITFLFFLYVPYVVSGQIPSLISYQGTLTDNNGNPVSDGEYGINFKLYTAADGGSEVWEEDQTILVVNGIFNVLLGSVEEFDIEFDEPYWLGISIEGGSEMLPRIQLSSSPYSMKAKTVEDGTITSDKINQMNAQQGQVLTWTGSSWQPQEPQPVPEVLFAKITYDGNLDQGNGVVSVTRPTDGQYNINFNRDVSTCALSATLLLAVIGSSAIGDISARVNPDEYQVRVYIRGDYVEHEWDDSEPANRAFFLNLVCP